jgi:hypothetical protein
MAWQWTLSSLEDAETIMRIQCVEFNLATEQVNQGDG